MGWSYGKNGRRKTGKKSRCPEGGGKTKTRKIKIAMVGPQ